MIEASAMRLCPAGWIWCASRWDGRRFDAPDLNRESDGTLPAASTLEKSGKLAGPAGPPPSSAAPGPAAPAGRKPVRLPRVILAPQDSGTLREQLLAELGLLTDMEAMT